MIRCTFTIYKTVGKIPTKMLCESVRTAKNLDGRPSQGGAGGSGAGAAFRTHQDTGTEPDSIINIVKNGPAVNT